MIKYDEILVHSQAQNTIIKGLFPNLSSPVDILSSFLVVMVVFDFSHMSSFQNAEQWKEDADNYTKEAFCFLVGTQKDIVVSTIFTLRS